MVFHYLLIIVWVILTVMTYPLNLPEILYEICPYSDICNRTASKSLHIKGLVPCCSSCKCDEKCGLRLDCCFDEMDKYRLEDKGIVACITPFTKDKIISKFAGAYWMIQTCKNESETGSYNNRDIPCEIYDRNDEYVGEPVSSKETGDIYVNDKCAICNKVYNFNKWNYLILAVHKQLGPFVWETKENQETIVYVPPHEEDWSPKRCFINYGEFNKKTPFLKLCQNLQAPYQHTLGSVYKNPLCLLNDERPDKELAKECKGEFGRNSVGRFTVLIDNSVTASSSKLRKNVMINKSLKPVCPTEVSVPSDSDSCLPIYCPDGMLMTPTGCRYFIRRWYMAAVNIQFKLWAIVGNELPAATLNALTLEERKNPLLWVKIPCRQVKATVIEVFYEIVKDSNETVDSFIVRLKKLTPAGIDPSIILPVLNNCLKYNWYIKILGEKYSFHSTLDKYSGYIQDGRNVRFHILTRTREVTKRPRLYERIATGPNPLSSLSTAWGRVALTKTYFCNQINLPMDDVETLFGEIRILSKNVTLGDNEFSINLVKFQNNESMYINDLNKSSVSVCLEDYDKSYYQPRSASALTSRIVLLDQLIIFYIILHVNVANNYFFLQQLMILDYLF